MERELLNREEIIINNIKNDNLWYRFIKRTFDIFLSLFLILVLSPIILLILIITIFVTNGHPFYIDKRIGYKGKEIKIFKFRSMVNDSYDLDKYLNDEQKEKWYSERKIINDPRITKFGKFLRKTSLDELPQLFNILISTMSFVGFRPINIDETKNYYPNELNNIFSSKPGLTGYWQVKSRSNASFKSGKRQSLELEYLTKRGFFFDLGIMLKTIPVIISMKGAM